MPNEILDGMTLDEALGCINRVLSGFVFKDKFYKCPHDLLKYPEYDCVGCVVCWEAEIDTYYDAKEENK